MPGAGRLSIVVCSHFAFEGLNRAQWANPAGRYPCATFRLVFISGAKPLVTYYTWICHNHDPRVAGNWPQKRRLREITVSVIPKVGHSHSYILFQRGLPYTENGPDYSLRVYDPRAFYTVKMYQPKAIRPPSHHITGLSWPSPFWFFWWGKPGKTLTSAKKHAPLV